MNEEDDEEKIRARLVAVVAGGILQQSGMGTQGTERRRGTRRGQGRNGYEASRGRGGAQGQRGLLRVIGREEAQTGTRGAGTRPKGWPWALSFRSRGGVACGGGAESRGFGPSTLWRGVARLGT